MIQNFDDNLAPAPIRDIPHITAHALQTAGLPDTRMQMTYWALSRFSDEDGHCQPLQSQLFAMLPDSESTIKRNLRKLEILGWIDVTEARWAFDGRRNVYRLTAADLNFPIEPHDPENKPGSFEDVLVETTLAIRKEVAELNNIRQELLEANQRNGRLEEQVRALAAGQGIDLAVIEGQIASRQNDTIEEEEEELLSGQNDTHPSSSSGPSSSGQAKQLQDAKGVKTPSDTQPELAVETLEPYVDPRIGEAQDWFRSNWDRLRHDRERNPDGWRMHLPRATRWIADNIEQFDDIRLDWETRWDSQSSASAGVPSLPAAPSLPAEPPEPEDMPEIRVDRIDEEAQSAWRQALEDYEEKLPAELFERHFRRTAGYAWEDGGCLLVAVRDGFSAEWLVRRFLGEITETLEAIAGRPVVIRFVVGELVIGEADGEEAKE